MSMPNAFSLPGAMLALALALPGVGVGAESALSARMAQQIIDGCAAHAKTKGQSHAIAVVDDGGHLLASLRMDGNAPGVGEFALAKAVAVAHWRSSTADMATAASQTPGFAAAPHVVTVAGGIPVYSADGKRFLGAIGVSGEAPQDDAACAAAGAKAAGLALARSP